MCCFNTAYSADINMYNRSYKSRMYDYNRALSNMYNRSIKGRYICNTVTVNDSSGMISHRIDCKPYASTSKPFSVIY